MFHIIEQEMQWRQKHGQLRGFRSLIDCQPVVAIGAEDPLEEQKKLADYFREWSCIIGSDLNGEHADGLLRIQMDMTGLGEFMIAYVFC